MTLPLVSGGLSSRHLGPVARSALFSSESARGAWGENLRMGALRLCFGEALCTGLFGDNGEGLRVIDALCGLGGLNRPKPRGLIDRGLCARGLAK